MLYEEPAELQQCSETEKNIWCKIQEIEMSLAGIDTGLAPRIEGSFGGAGH
jgi:hypothetical protein